MRPSLARSLARLAGMLTACCCAVGLAETPKGDRPLVSKVLGPLPAPEELAAAHEHLGLPPRNGLPARRSIDAATARRYDRLYHYVTFKDHQLYGDYGSQSIPLGITGIHANEYRNRHELFVVEVEKDSPAEGRVFAEDIILGANGRLFEELDHLADPRIPMGYSLAEAQTAELGGVLTLHLVRNGRFLNVPVELGVEGPYSPTWPFDCEKSRRMGDRLVAMILERYGTGRRLTSRHSGGSWWHALILLGAGEDRALERARRSVYEIAGVESWDQVREAVASGNYPLPEQITGSSWVLSYELIILCEYYLQTGDSAVLPAVVWKKHLLEKGQAPSGSWCHGMGMGGYGEVNATGGACFVALALAAECGVEMDPVALDRSARFFRQFVGGGVPYGNHSPGPLGSSDNGKNAMPAVAFAILGDEEAAGGLARPTCYSYLCRENGHADGSFAFSWGPLGALRAPAPEFHLFMNNLIWYYELARTGDGALIFLRGCHWSRPYGCSGPMGMVLMMPRRKLRIVGGPRTVFGTRPPKGLREAERLYKLKRWDELEQFLHDYLSRDSRGEGAEYARRLLAACRAQEKHVQKVLEMIRRNIDKGDAWTASEQLAALRLLLGEERPEMARLREYLESAEGQAAIAQSKKWERPGPLPAKSAPVFDPGPRAPVRWKMVLPPLAAGQTKAQYLKVSTPDEPPADWYAETCGDSQWHEITRPPADPTAAENSPARHLLRRTFDLDRGKYRFLQLETPCGGEVYLNGYRIATYLPDPAGTRRDRKDPDLRSVAAELLRPGRNVVAASLYGAPAIDLTLRVGPCAPDTQSLKRGLIRCWTFDSDEDLPADQQWSTVPGKFGRALQAEQPVTIAGFRWPSDSGGRLDDATLAMWVRLPTERKGMLRLSCGIDARGRPTGPNSWAVEVGPSATMRLRSSAAENPQRIPGSKGSPLFEQGFQHLAWVYDGTKHTASIYVNGQLLFRQSIDPAQPALQDGPVVLSAASAAAVDELSLWSRALSEAELLDLVLGGEGTSLASPRR